MKTIYKYPFRVGSVIEAPAGKVVLVAHEDRSGTPTIWIEHETNAPSDTHYQFVGTGGFIPRGEHVGSAICAPFVWHVYRLDTPT